MRVRRLTALLVGHALAEGESAGDALREAGLSAAFLAAPDADAGRLGSALRRAHLGPDLTAVAEAWPSAMRLADRRLVVIPSRLVMQAQMVQTLLYLMLVGGLQLLMLSVLRDKVAPSLMGMQLGSVDHFAWIHGSFLALTAGLPVVFAVLVSVVFVPVRIPGWGRHLERAREAALAAAMYEAGAPEDARRAIFSRFRVLQLERSNAEDLDRVFHASLVRAEGAQRRLVGIVRVTGLSALVAIAAVSTGAIYSFVSQIHLAI